MSRPSAIPLGPFDLVSPAGRGAMAEVWRATHRSRGVPVAVKVVTAPSGRAERFRRMFHDEVRATARLDHPGVIRLYDHGEVPAEVAASTRGRLPRGAPYLVMEWVGGGTLRTRKGRLGWPALRSILLTLLDALAHAHARGVIHRDLKAANVLIGDRGPVLTDFGLAFDRDHVDADLESSARLGTPNFMAPEQVAGDWRALGPWTDLYALGCLAYALSTGKAPFAGRGARRIMRAHLEEDPPPLVPTGPVPHDFEGWIQRLMAKRPGARFQFAADAAVGLLALAEPDRLDPDATDPEGMALDDGLDLEDVTLVSPPVFLPLEDMSWSLGPAGLDGRPPVPRSWRGPPPPPIEPPLPGVGRALFGMRETAFVGRTAARDQLWDALRRVTNGEGARAVLVEGPSGQGKSHLVAWMCQRAHELGSADSMRAAHDAHGGPGTGLGPMLERSLRCIDMRPEERPATIRQVLGDELGVDSELPAALAAVMDARGRFNDEATAVTVSSDRERYETICRGFDLLAWRRPIIVWLDDVQWGVDAVRFTEYLLTRHRHLPVLVAATARDDALLPGTAEREAVDRLCDGRYVDRLRLEPLGAEALTQVVRARLPIGQSLADLIYRRSAGSPLFAEQLVRHWIRTDALTDGPDGFRLKAGAESGLPSDLAEVWRARIIGAVTSADEAAWQALEGAAVLGMVVDRAEWAEVCARAGQTIPATALEQLLDERLMHAVESDRWAFAHAMIRETLLKRARDAGRWQVWNVLCGAVLADQADPEPARLAGYMMAAGDVEAALDPLMDATRRALGRGDYISMRRLLLTRARALRAARVPSSDAAWIENRVYWTRLDVLGERLAAARRRAAKAVDSARALGDPRLLALALTELGRVRQTTDPQRGAALMLEARDAAREAGDLRLQAEALRRAGWCLAQGGRFDEAEEAHEEALICLRGIDDPFTEGGIYHTRTLVAWKLGQLDRAAEMGARGMELFTRSGDRFGLGNVSNTLGDVARYQGDLVEAENWYRQAIRLKSAVGSQADDTELNLALTLVELGRFPEARTRIDSVIERARAVDHTVILAFCSVTMLPCDAYAADWASWDARWYDMALFTEGKLAEPDAARALRLAARMARSVGEIERAEQAEELAALQDVALGRPAGEASTDGASLDGASADGASLDGASADGASLDGASADGASLEGDPVDTSSAAGIDADHGPTGPITTPGVGERPAWADDLADDAADRDPSLETLGDGAIITAPGVGERPAWAEVPISDPDGEALPTEVLPELPPGAVASRPSAHPAAVLPPPDQTGPLHAAPDQTGPLLVAPESSGDTDSLDGSISRSDEWSASASFGSSHGSSHGSSVDSASGSSLGGSSDASAEPPQPRARPAEDDIRDVAVTTSPVGWPEGEEAPGALFDDEVAGSGGGGPDTDGEIAATADDDSNTARLPETPVSFADPDDGGEPTERSIDIPQSRPPMARRATLPELGDDDFDPTASSDAGPVRDDAESPDTARPEPMPALTLLEAEQTDDAIDGAGLPAFHDLPPPLDPGDED